jgi:hypothetical protein
LKKISARIKKIYSINTRKYGKKAKWTFLAESRHQGWDKLWIAAILNVSVEEIARMKRERELILHRFYNGRQTIITGCRFDIMMERERRLEHANMTDKEYRDEYSEDLERVKHAIRILNKYRIKEN